MVSGVSGRFLVGCHSAATSGAIVARELVTDDLRFVGVMGPREGADNYFSDMAKMKFKYDVQHVFEDGNNVCLWYDIDMGGKTIFSAGWYKLKGGKIGSFKVLFDPRPLLQEKK